MQKRLLSAAIVSAVLSCGSAAVHAQSSGLEDRLRTQLRATIVQLRQLQDAQAQLQADKSAAEQQRDKAVADLKQAQGDLEATKGKSGKEAAAESSLAAERASHARDTEQLAKYKSAYDDLVRQSRTQDAQRTQALNDLKVRETQLQTCEAKNAKLYEVGHDILDAYEHVDLGTFLKTRQPFAEKARVKYDEIAQQFGDQLYAGKYNRNAVAPAVGASAVTKAAAAQ